MTRGFAGLIAGFLVGFASVPAAAADAASAGTGGSDRDPGRTARPAADGPATFPAIRFRWPLRNQDWSHVANYVDLDPASPAILDWGCQAVTYDGHTGNDLLIRDFTEMDAGRWVLAAADGVVAYVVDGYFDRTVSGPFGRSNYIRLDHPDGTRSWYYHLRKWSSIVTVGQGVVAGQPLGLVGSSGPSTWPHLHFEVDNAGTIYEPFAGACRAGVTLWNFTQPPHTLTSAVSWMDSGIRLTPPAYSDIVERPATVAHIRQTGPTIPFYYWVKLNDIHNGDISEVTLKRPNGTTYATLPVTHTAPSPNNWLWITTNLPTSGSLGTWTAEYRLNGILRASQTFAFNTTAYAAPVATGRSVSAGKGTASGDLRASDADGGIERYQVVSPPAAGELRLGGHRWSRFEYVPSSGFSGAASFTFTATDSQGAVSAPATMTLNVTPVVQNALRLEDEGDYLSVPASPLLDLPGPFTVEAWIRRAPGSSEYQRLFDRRDTSGLTDQQGFSLFLLWDNHLYFSIGNGSFAQYAYGTSAIPLGRWVHVAATWDGTWMRLYVNGRLDTPFPSFFTGPVSWSGTGALRLGNGFYSTLEEGFRGEIEEMRLWSVARSEAELRAGATCAFFDAPAPPATLRGWWRFQGSATDQSPAALHATAVGGASFRNTDPAIPLTCLVQNLDGDALPDGADNCPLVASPSQANGDGDPFGDACDLCPASPDTLRFDTDGDSVGDRCDNCPFDGNTEQPDGDSDGAGDLCDPAPASSSSGVPAGTLHIDVAPAGPDSVISWPALPLAASYEVYRATRPMLDQRFYGLCQNSRDPVTTDLSFAENQVPAPGEAWFYQVLGVNGTGAGATRGLAGTDSAGRQRDLRAGDCP